jgi:hypothetical protein
LKSTLRGLPRHRGGRWGARKVQPDQSVADRSEATSAGKPGNGSPKPDGAGMQAASLTLEKYNIVVLWDTSPLAEESRRLGISEGNRDGRDMASSRPTTGS